MHPKDLFDKLRRLSHDLAVTYIKSNLDLLDTNLEAFIAHCPPSCELEVKEMLLKAGIEVPDTSLKQWDKLLSDCVKKYKIDYEKTFEDYTSYILNNKSDWKVIDISPVMEETL